MQLTKKTILHIHAHGNQKVMKTLRHFLLPVLRWTLLAVPAANGTDRTYLQGAALVAVIVPVSCRQNLHQQVAVNRCC